MNNIVATPHPGDPFGHAKAHLDELSARYPEQFARPMISCSWPAGWHPLIVSVCDFVAVHHPMLWWEQIKEKFGCLKMHHSWDPSYLRGVRADRTIYPTGIVVDSLDFVPSLGEALDRVEMMSMATCCLCGNLARAATVGRRSFGGWILPACAECTPRIRDYFNSRNGGAS